MANKEWRMSPLPDEMTARDGTKFNPNRKSEYKQQVKDRRPEVLYPSYNADGIPTEFSEEYWIRKLATTNFLDKRSDLC